MKNFSFYNPTRLIFGKDSVSRLSEYVPKGAKVLLTYGGGSVKKLGIYDSVISQLSEREVIEFGGIESNPDVATIRRAVELAKERDTDFILAVGGGSVIDASKLIAASALTEKDPWEIVKEGRAERGLPLGVILTVPATGSEMNGAAVISNRERKEKFSFYGIYPVFSILDPTYSYTLSDHQACCGIADAFVHILEQYLTFPQQSGIMDRMAEGVLLNLLDVAQERAKDPNNYSVACEYMLSATMALNGFLGMGIEQDWLTHKIGHEITALTGATHGASLAMVYPSVLRVLRKPKEGKILQLGARVFGITGANTQETIDRVISRLEEFFHSLGLCTSMREAGISGDVAGLIASRFAERGKSFGENGIGTPVVVGLILEDSCRS